MTMGCSDLSGIVLTAQDAVIGQELDGTIASWNAGAAEIFGYASSDILGHSMDLLSAGATENFLREVQLIRSGQCVRAYYDIFRRKNGDSFIGSTAISRIVDTSGNCLGLSRIIRPAGGFIASLDEGGQPQAESQRRLLLQAGAAASGQTQDILLEDFHQPLTAIVAYLRSMRLLLAGSSRDEEKLNAAVEQAFKQAGRAAEILHKLSSRSAEDLDRRLGDDGE